MAGSNLRQPLFWCQALHVLHSSSHLTGVCTGTDYVDHSSTGLTGVALLLACFSVHYYKLAHVLQNVQRTVTAFLPSHKQAQADANPSGLVSKVCSEKASSRCLLCSLPQDSSCKNGICIVCEHVLHTMKSHVHAHA